MLSVVFDMDGVLFDTQKVYVRTWEEVAKILHIENFEVPLKLCIGRNRIDQVDILKSHCGEDFPFDEFYELKEQIFNKHIDEEGVPLMKGTKEMLVTLKKLGARVAIASSSRDDVVKHHLEETGLTDYFDIIVGGNQVEHSKPSPDIYLKACEKLSVNPKETFAVEDSYNGIRSAVAAGLKTIMIPDTLPPTKEFDEVLERRFTSLMELADYFTLKALMERLWSIYPYASVLYEKQSGKSLSASGRGISAMQDKLSCARGYVVKAYDGTRYVEYSFNRLSPDNIDEITDRIRSTFQVKELLGENFECSSYEMPEDSAIHSFSENVINNHPEELGDKKIVEILTELRKLGLNADEKITDCSVRTSYKQSYKLFISPNREMSENILWMTCVLSMMAKKGDVIKSYFKTYSNLDGAKVLEKLGDDIENTAKNVVELLEAGQIKPGKYECICAPDVTGMIVHEAFGHGVEMDMFVKDRALAKDFIGKYVASELVTMHDGAAAATEVATYDFDDEGMPAKDTVIIEKGILKTGISDAQTALSLKCPSTGNGRRENYERKAYTRMTNTFFEGGNDKVEDMIKSIKYGFMLENATCGMEDPKNWGIQCMVNVAREIKDGEFTGKVFSPIVLSGYVPELLKSISMMSETTVLSGGGYCGKGYKEWVKVSDGGPYIKAEIELG